MDINELYNKLGTLFKAGDNAAAEKFLLESLENSEQDPMLGIAVCNELGGFYRGISRFEASEKYFLRAHRLLWENGLGETEQDALVMMNSGGTLRLKGELPRAVECFENSKKMMDNSKNCQNIIKASLYNNLALVYCDNGEYKKAVQMFLDALAIIRDVGGSKVKLATTYNNIAMALKGAGRPDEGFEWARRSEEIFKEERMENNPHYPATLNTCGIFAYDRGDYEEALRYFSKALEGTERVFGKNAEYARGCKNCAAACAGLGRTDDMRRYEAKFDECRLH